MKTFSNSFECLGECYPLKRPGTVIKESTLPDEEKKKVFVRDGSDFGCTMVSEIMWVPPSFLPSNACYLRARTLWCGWGLTNPASDRHITHLDAVVPNTHISKMSLRTNALVSLLP
jgi:hypothetical protein